MRKRLLSLVLLLLVACMTGLGCTGASTVNRGEPDPDTAVPDPDQLSEEVDVPQP